MEEIKDGMPDEQQVLELGIMLGQRRVFGMLAGRCSAAQAECLRQVRGEKTYLKFATTWDAHGTGRLHFPLHRRIETNPVFIQYRAHGPLQRRLGLHVRTE